MNEIKKWLTIVLMSLLCCIVIGCSNQEDESTSTETEILKDNEVYVYYVNKENTKLLSKVLELTDITEVNQSIDEILKVILKDDNKNGFRTAIPSNFIYKNYKLADGNLTLYFDLTDDDWTIEEALFAKAALVKSFLQIDGIDNISISTNDLVSKETDPIYIETFDEDSFVYLDSDDNGFIQSGNVTIYFADEAGENLIEYHKKVDITNNVSLEQIVIESLIKGPLREGYKATIPKDVIINKVSVKDGVCYLDLSQEFNGSLDDIRSDLTIYSVVNSLVELPTINKVQFFINGEKQDFYRETIEFSGLFERNLEIIDSSNRNPEEATQTTEVSTEDTSTQAVVE